jgi:hypothetical protein
MEDFYDFLPKPEMAVDISWRVEGVVDGKTKLISEGNVQTQAKTFLGPLPTLAANQSGNVKYSEQTYVVLIKKSATVVLPLDINATFTLVIAGKTYKSYQAHDFLVHYSIYCSVAS